MDTTTDYTLTKPDSALSWKIHAGSKIVGTVWLDLEETDYLEAPAIHITIDDDGQDAGERAMKETIKYAYCNLPYQELYSRYLVTNKAAEKLCKTLGFEIDGKVYKDEDDLEWQNVKLVL